MKNWLAREYPGISARFLSTRNPANKRGGKEKRDVTDRAHRYRANADPPLGPRICALCGSTRNIDVGHVNGHEEDNSAANKVYMCRRCNVRCANALRRVGLGRLTRQYNPASEGAPNLGAWVNAALSIKGDPGGNMPVAEAVDVIRATPPDKRSSYAREIWAIRRRRGTDRSEVPF